MFGLLGLGLAGLLVVGLLGAVVSIVLWAVVLPFKLLGLVFRGIGVLLALPFMLAIGILGAVLFGAGMLVFLIPALPLVLVVTVIWWLMRRRGSHAKVVAH